MNLCGIPPGWLPSLLGLLLVIRTVHPKCLAGFASYEGVCYGGPQDALYSWNGAEQYCQTQGGHLTSVTSLAEYNFILQLIRGFNKNYPSLWNEVWIGLFHPNPVNFDSDYETNRRGWQWTDGAPYAFNAWGPYDPTNNEKYGRISHGMWLGSLTGNNHNNFICKITANPVRVGVPQVPPVAPMTTSRYVPPQKTVNFPWRTAHIPRVTTYPPLPPLPQYPRVKTTRYHNNPYVTSGVSSTLRRARGKTTIPADTSTTTRKGIQEDTDRNVLLNTDRKQRPPEKRLQEEEKEVASGGMSMKLIPVAVVVPAIALIMLIILIIIIRRRSLKSNKFEDSETKSSNQGIQMSPMSTMRDPTSTQYYNETYRSLSSLFRNAPKLPPIYGNVPSGRNTLKSIHGNVPSRINTLKSTYGNVPSTTNTLKTVYGNVPSETNTLKSIYSYEPSGIKTLKSTYGNVPSETNTLKSTYGNVPSDINTLQTSYGSVPSGSNTLRSTSSNATSITDALKSIFGNMPSGTNTLKSVNGYNSQSENTLRSVYGNVPSGTGTMKTCYENNYIE